MEIQENGSAGEADMFVFETTGIKIHWHLLVLSGSYLLLAHYKYSLSLVLDRGRGIPRFANDWIVLCHMFGFCRCHLVNNLAWHPDLGEVSSVRCFAICLSLLFPQVLL